MVKWRNSKIFYYLNILICIHTTVFAKMTTARQQDIVDAFRALNLKCSSSGNGFGGNLEFYIRDATNREELIHKLYNVLSLQSTDEYLCIHNAMKQFIKNEEFIKKYAIYRNALREFNNFMDLLKVEYRENDGDGSGNGEILDMFEMIQDMFEMIKDMCNSCVHNNMGDQLQVLKERMDNFERMFVNRN